eukprot:Skav207266  [mRNA]  locus=scaffold434:23600:25226:- [translate_table: standard]
MHLGACTRDISPVVNRSGKEPRWHRALRNRRRRLRSQLATASRTFLGARKRKRILAIVRELTPHHSWNPFQVPLAVRLQVKMTWWCSLCRCNNNSDAEFCAQCKGHWSETWKKRRSRSKQGNKDKRKDVKSQPPSTPSAPSGAKKDGAGKDDPWAVFPDKVPWITGTPQAHLASQEIQRTVTAPDTALPPPPVLPPPPPTAASAPALTSEEQQALSHLRGLAGLGMQMPPELEAKFQSLVAKEKEGVAGRSLSHTHLHKLNKLRAQVSSAEKRILSLDQEWKTFVAEVNTRLQVHGHCYQKCRADLLEAYNKRVAEFAAAKEDVSQASQILVGQHTPALQAPPTMDPFDDLHALQEAMTRVGTVDVVQAISDDGMEEEEELEAASSEALEDRPKEKPRKADKHPAHRDVKIAPFTKGASSPTKVNQHHLKSSAPPHKARKEERDKGADKEEDL